MRASHGCRTLPSPSGPMPPGDHAARGPRGTSTHGAQPGRPATPSHSRSSAAQPAVAARGTGGLAVRTPGHLDAGRLDTRRLDTGCVDAGRPLDRLDGRPHGRTGRGGQGNDRPGRRSDILATGDDPPGGPTSSGHGAWGRSAIQDGSAVTAPGPRP